MNKKSFLLIAILVIASPILAKQRTVSFTIDDLPVVTRDRSEKNKTFITKQIIAKLAKDKVPAIGFVNENKLFKDGERNLFEIGLLQMWIDAGLELGNHTVYHKSFHSVDFEEYKDQVVRGDVITNELLAREGKWTRYFRHPFLHTGRTIELKKKLDEVLIGMKLRIAPVSIDNSDWLFASAYEKALLAKDEKMSKRIADEYIAYLDRKVAYWEKQSVELLGREISQIMLLHANRLNADHIEKVQKVFIKRGYRFVDLETSLKDPAYKRPDEFTGRGGISWLHRWAVKDKKVTKDEPRTAKWVMEYAGIKSE